MVTVHCLLYMFLFDESTTASYHWFCLLNSNSKSRKRPCSKKWWQSLQTSAGTSVSLVLQEASSAPVNQLAFPTVLSVTWIWLLLSWSAFSPCNEHRKVCRDLSLFKIILALPVSSIDYQLNFVFLVQSKTIFFGVIVNSS